MRVVLRCVPDQLAEARRALRVFVDAWDGGPSLSYMAQLAITELLSEFLERREAPSEATVQLSAAFVDGRLHVVLEGLALAGLADSLRMRVVEAVTDELVLAVGSRGEQEAVSLTFPRE